MAFLYKPRLRKSKAALLSRKLSNATDSETGDTGAIAQLIADNPMMKNLKWSNRGVALVLIDAGKELVKRSPDKAQTLWNMLLAADLSQSAKVRKAASRNRKILMHKSRFEPKF